MNLQLSNNDINKLDFAFNFCEFLKKYYMDVYSKIYGVGAEADLKFVKQFYSILDDRNKFLEKFSKILDVHLNILENEADENEFFPDSSDIFNFDEAIEESRKLQSKLYKFF